MLGMKAWISHNERIGIAPLVSNNKIPKKQTMKTNCNHIAYLLYLYYHALAHTDTKC